MLLKDNLNRLTEKGSSMDYYSSDLYHSTKDIDTQVLIVVSVNNNYVIFSIIIKQTFSIMEDHIFMVFHQ